MLKVSAANFHQSLQIDDEVIILNGPPQALTGSVSFRNKEAQTIFIREIPFSPSGNDNNDSLFSADRIKLLTSLQPGEQRVEQLTFQLPASTPPGTYEKKINADGREKTVRMIVQPNVEIDITPATLFFQGVAAGKTYTAELTLTNRGNLTFSLPATIRHTTMLDEDYFCRALSLAIRHKGGEGFNPVMDELTRNIHKELTDWVDVRIQESGTKVQPGKTIQLHLSLTLPRNVHPSRDYAGNIRISNTIIAYQINAYEDSSTPK